jgi:tetratricopeptide (TPR) repeat protein
LLPILVLSIRWKSHSVQFGDDSRLGVFLTKTTVHIVHAFFFLGTFWLALDPTFGPRHLELGTPLLGYYYLCALVFGYCAGYFLVFGARRASEVPGIGPGRLWGRIYAALQSRAPRLAVGAGIMLACALPALLAGKNLHQILTTNGPFLRTSVRQIYTDLPAGKSVVLSDSTPELLLLQAELSTHQDEKQPLLLETPALASAQYQRVMARKFPDRWPQSAPTNRAGGVGPGKILELVAAFTAREPVLQLQPSFGLWLEIFSERPSGCVYYLEPRKADDTTQLPRGAPTVKVAQPGTDATVAGSQALAGQLADRAEQVWQHRWTELLEKVAETTRNNARFPPGPGRALRVGLRLASEPNRTATFIGAAYSRRLNDWGVRRQCLGRAQDAKQWFERALALNPENLTARINLEYAERCQRGDRARLNVASFESEYSGLFARQSDWRASLGANGPVDEPSFLFRTGRLLLALGSPRQAIAAFARAAELAPDWPAPKLWQAQGYVQVRDFAAALGVTEQIQPPNLPQDGAGLARLLDCRAAALLGLGRTNEAARCLESFLSQYANYDEVLLVASEIYAQHQQFEAGLRLVEELLARAPNRPDLLARKGLAQLQLSRYDAAIITLTTALTLAPRNDEVRLYRAVAYLGAEQFGAARADYQELLKTPAHHGNALFGLGTIAWQQQETNVAIGYYQQYLSNSVPGSSQYAVAVGRLEALQSKEVK